MNEFSLCRALSEIPVARPGMTAEELRAICLAYMRLAVSFPYIPSETYTYTVQSFQVEKVLSGEKVYAGLPYVTKGAGNLYRAARRFDGETGRLSVEAYREDPILFGNACSGAAVGAWSRAVTSILPGYTKIMTKKNGYLPVGEYRYPEDVAAFREGETPYSVRDAVTENGDAVMFESYARLLPADGLVNDGHVRMNSAVPTVVRRADGSIDGDESFTCFCDQGCFNDKESYYRRLKRTDLNEDDFRRQLADGREYFTQGHVDKKITFRKLFDTGYIPVTFGEFQGTVPVKTGAVSFSFEGKSITAEAFAEAKVTASYPIADLLLFLSDEAGNPVAKAEGLLWDFIWYEVPAGEKAFTDLLREKGRPGLTVTLSAQLYNGELLTAYEGTLQ